MTVSMLPRCLFDPRLWPPIPSLLFGIRGARFTFDLRRRPLSLCKASRGENRVCIKPRLHIFSAKVRASAGVQECRIHQPQWTRTRKRRSLDWWTLRRQLKIRQRKSRARTRDTNRSRQKKAQRMLGRTSRLATRESIYQERKVQPVHSQISAKIQTQRVQYVEGNGTAQTR
jgi:hypothetical protein